MAEKTLADLVCLISGHSVFDDKELDLTLLFVKDGIMIDVPTLEQLECLITWPRGSKGWQSERALLAVLLMLCKGHGFGRVPQLCAAIEEIWRDPSRREAHEKLRKQHFVAMSWVPDELRDIVFENIEFGTENQMVGDCKHCAAKKVLARQHLAECPEKEKWDTQTSKT
jgi:hypothetical protein